ncbi:transcription initiation factor TFIID subunit 2 [Candida albicans P60002]|nr:transcription initiation factor TFIID subunit 2 [Candida albicans P60002]
MPSASNHGTPRMVGGLINTPLARQINAKKVVNPVIQSFKVAHQRVNIDIDLSSNSIDGFTELTVIPTSNKLKVIKLDCREMEIKDVLINGSRSLNYVYDDLLYINNPEYFEHCIDSKVINVMDLYSDTFNVHQHHLIRSKLDYIFKNPKHDEESLDYNTQELKILLPDNMKFELTDINSIQTPSGTSHPGTTTPSHLKSKGTGNEYYYTPIQLKVVYKVKNPQNGVNFVTNEDIEKKLWHAYTTNSNYNVSTSSWVPCIDDLSSRCTWSLEVNIPRTLKDIGNPRMIGSKEALDYQQMRRKRSGEATQNFAQQNNDSDDDDDDEDIGNYDMVVPSGDFNNVKETPHPIDLSKKVVSWSIFNPVCAHHVGWAVGCFESFVLSDESAGAKEDDEEDTVLRGDDAENVNNPVTIYSLPEDVEWAKNTSIITNKALDFFSKEYGSFPFSSYAIVFVRYSPCQTSNFAGLSVMSSKLLYPPDMIEPMFTVTDILLKSIATQWAGINISPQTFNDMWCTIGIAGFMAISFIKKLMGANEFRYRLRKQMDKVVAEDVGRHAIASQPFKYPVSEDDLSFVWLKSPIVLFILDNRMTKTDKSFGLSRVLPKLFLQAMSGSLPNGTLNTEHFRYVCEKVNRNKLENFFKQWVFGTGAPVFRISQRFNKKKGMIEMNIRQVQHHERTPKKLDSSSFIGDAVAYLDNEPSPPQQHVFTGPMTIRVHESDGSPYEHIVELKEANTKLDIQYNSKFRKIKKKDDGVDPGIAFNQFGDVLLSHAEMQEWNLRDWDKRDEESLSSEPFEWIRGDVDFEWIARIDIKQPDFMFGSQLVYDRDIEAQLEAVRYFGELEKTNTTYCTALTRTLMDDRYFYGVRIAAAQALADCSNEANNFIGLEYLLKAFGELYCFDDSFIPKSNDFSDFRGFMLQSAFPRILCGVKDNDGKVPKRIQNLLLNLVKFNDNSMNAFVDSLYVSELVVSLVTSTVSGWRNDIEEYNDTEFAGKVSSELFRLQKLDRWIPSYQNIIEVTCIQQNIRMALVGARKLSFEELLYMTLDKYPMEARVEAFRGILELGGLKNKSILQYFLKVCLLNFERPLYRSKLIEALVKSVSSVATYGGVSTLDDPEFHTKVDTNVKSSSNRIIIDDGSQDNSAMKSKRDDMARASIKGAIEILRRDFSEGQGLRETLWELLHTSLIGLHERRSIFCLCQVLFKEVDSYVVKLPVPSMPVEEYVRKKIVAKVSNYPGQVTIKREGRFKIQLATRKSVIAKVKSETEHKPLKISLKPVIEAKQKAASAVHVDPVIPTKVTFKLPGHRLAGFAKKVELDGTLVTIKLGRDMKSKVDALAHRYVRINTKRRKIEVSKVPFIEKEEGSNTSGVTEVSRNTGEKEDAKSPSPILVKKEKRRPKVYIHFGGNVKKPDQGSSSSSSKEGSTEVE